MPQPSCMCTVLLKLAKVERLKIRKIWVHVLIITVIISTWTQNFHCRAMFVVRDACLHYQHGFCSALILNLCASDRCAKLRRVDASEIHSSH